MAYRGLNRQQISALPGIVPDRSFPFGMGDAGMSRHTSPALFMMLQMFPYFSGQMQRQADKIPATGTLVLPEDCTELVFDEEFQVRKGDSVLPVGY